MSPEAVSTSELSARSRTTARARIKAEKEETAIQALQTAFDEAPRNAEVRKLLFRLYRNGKNWTALAGALSRATEHVTDEATVLSYAREAARFNVALRPASTKRKR